MSALLVQVRRLAKEELRVALQAVDEAIAAYEALDDGERGLCEGLIADLLASRARLLASDAECDRHYRTLSEELPS